MGKYREVRVDKYGKKNRELKKGLREEKEGNERWTSMHMKKRFFCRLAGAATQYFNMLPDPDRPGLELVCQQCVVL